MWPNVWLKIKRCTGGAMVLLALAVPAAAQQPADQRLDKLEKQNEEFRKQVEILMKQNQALQTKMNSVQATTVSAPGGPVVSRNEVKELVEEYLAQTQPKLADGGTKIETAPGAYRIGSDLGMTASWKNGVVLATRNNDFSMHIGGWLQYDNVWWTETPGLTAAKGGNAGKKQGVLSGTGTGGIGDLQDGTYFRRIRFVLDGTFWENYEFNVALAFENDQFQTVGLDEVWAGVTNVPFIGTIRAGHTKVAHGLEADMTGSSKTMTFMERSSYSETIESNQNFMTGLWIGNNYFDQRATWSTSIGRLDPAASTGADFGDGQYAAFGRLTALPLYDCDGRQFLHLGASGGWQRAQNSPTGPNAIQIRARPELRDDVPAGGFTNADANRMIDTGILVCDSQSTFGTELLYVRGPFSLQAEYGWARLDNVSGSFNGTPGVFVKTVGGNQNYVFNGGYVQLAYTLTGESRAYDKRLGRLNTNYFGANGPFTNAWFVRDEDGRLNWGLGAWEVAARYSYVNLNDGAGLNRVEGGKMDGLSLGLNWYLNANLKVQFEYIYDHRYATPIGSTPGYTGGFGTRMQLMW
jgi:phosphate-selective porin OprO and OprP